MKNTLIVSTAGIREYVEYQERLLAQEKKILVIAPSLYVLKRQKELAQRKMIATALLTPTLSMKECDAIVKQMHDRNLRILYVAADCLAIDYFRKKLEDLGFILAIVEEAQQISELSHNFDFKYQNIVSKLKKDVHILALSTAITVDVQIDIAQQLQIKESNIIVESIVRPNINFNLIVDPSDENKNIVAAVLERYKQAGIIFINTRKRIESLVKSLKRKNISVAAYHNGMTIRERKDIQEDFRKGELQLIVAARDLALEFDKKDINFTIHVQSAPSIEDYCQEIRVLGLDGQEAQAIMIYHPKDATMYRRIIDSSNMDEKYQQNLRQRLLDIFNYVYSEKCLQRVIMQYFDQDVAICKKCLNCSILSEKVDVSEDARAIILAVDELKQFASKTKVIQSVVKANPLEKKSKITDLYNYLAANNYLTLSLSPTSYYPRAKVSELGEKVLDGKKQIFRKKKNIVKCSIDSNFSDTTNNYVLKYPNINRDEVFEILRETRLKLAREEGVPAFMIFSNSTLRDMANKLPEYSQEMLKVNGVGSTKLAQYGDIMLQSIEKIIQSSTSN